MYLLLTIVVFIIIFSIIVLVHELGHFFAAKRSGVFVEEFGIGLPPRIFSIKRGETIYSINLLPFGGFVRMLGEDSKDPKMMADPRSFVGKPIRSRVKIIVAGVLMNFILAILLLSVGFSVGIKPLIITEEDVLSNIDKGVMQIEEGFVIKNVEEKSHASDLGFKPGDVIMQVNNKDVSDYASLNKIFGAIPSEWPTFKLRRGDSIVNIQLRGREGNKSGIDLYEMFFLPRVIVKNIVKDTDASRLGIKEGDIILKMNDEQIYSLDRFQEILNESPSIKFLLMRDYKKLELTLNLPSQKSVIVGDVTAGSPAEKAGFLRGDYVLQINRQIVMTPEQVVNHIKNSIGSQAQFLVDRNGQKLTFFAAPDSSGQVGLAISSMISPENSQFGAYMTLMPTSVIDVKDVRYPVYEAVVKSFSESKRLAVFTVGVFGKLLKDVFGQLEVPKGVSGPVGIAHMTYVFVKEGFSSLIRFTALLSLSIAVINILPFPGLDGGRLMFIVIEGITGRKVNQKLEAWLHLMGFVLLLALIVLITYKDVAELLS